MCACGHASAGLLLLLPAGVQAGAGRAVHAAMHNVSRGCCSCYCCCQRLCLLVLTTSSVQEHWRHKLQTLPQAATCMVLDN